MPNEIDCRIVGKCLEVLASKSRYGVITGGRGKGASWSVARYSLIETASSPIRNLCTREFQNSIKDSTHRILCDQIEAMGLSPFYDMTRESIKSKCGGEYIFKGLRNNYAEIKSTEGIDRCYCEEAERISADSWDVLIPTIRKEGSRIIVVFNPDDENGETYRRFVKSPPDDCIIREVNFPDNPWFPEVLRREMEYDKRVDPEKYEHIWLGKPKKYGNACIFKGKVFVEDFEAPEGTQFYFGADFGFSQDPTCLIRCWVKDKCLFIDHEAYGVGIEIEELPALFRSVPEALGKDGLPQWRIIADSARPETISFLANKGFCIDGARKGKGSVEDGIQFLRSFERIVIHPRCKGSISDFQNYKWKTDRITNDILPIPLDCSNHATDAVRYALEDYISNDSPAIWSPFNQ